jgi:hypothetical protein
LGLRCTKYVIGGWAKFHYDEMHDFDYSSNAVFLGDQSRGERREGMWKAMGRREMHIGFKRCNLKDRAACTA